MRFNLLVRFLSLLLTFLVVGSAFAEHRVLMQGKGKLAIVGEDGAIEWEMKWGGIHDLHVLDNGHIMVQRNMREVVEIDPESKEVVWSYDSSKENGNEGKKIEVHAFQPLDDGNVMIAESGRGRIIEINRDGEIQKEIKLKIENPHPHTDTRLVRKLESGNYLVCHERDGAVREYDGDGKVVWDYEIPMFGKAPQGGHGLGAFGNKCFAALRLESGNTLIATGNGHSVIEVSPDKEIVWQIHQNDLPGIQLAWVTTLEVLPNGNYAIGNCHAGPRNPLIVEVDPKTRKVVWQFDKFDVFGNSAPNSRILDANGDATAGEAKVLSFGDPAPPIKIAEWVKGKPIESFQDGQVYVVEFWATWCGPCLAGMPHISELQHEYGERVKFIGVTDEDEETVTTFLKKDARGNDGTWDDVIQYTLARDEKETTNTNYMKAARRNGIPCAFIIGKDQHIEWIGHPMAIDDALAAVVGDEWDREAEGAKYEQSQRAERLRDEAMPAFSKAFRAKDWVAALAVMTKLEKVGALDVRGKMLKARILENAEMDEELVAWRAKMIEESWDVAEDLNDISWGLATARGEKSDESLEQALRAAERANELTKMKDGSVLDTLARVQYEMGNLEAAIEIQRQAVKFTPTQQIKRSLQQYEGELKATNKEENEAEAVDNQEE